MPAQAAGGLARKPAMPAAKPAMPAKSNAGGATRGLARAAQMSGRTMPAAGGAGAAAGKGMAAGAGKAMGMAKKATRGY